MPIEAYALVTFPKPLTKEEKEWQAVMRQEERGITNMVRKMALAYAKEETVVKLCHIRLIQPLGKDGSVPKPRWDVIEELLIDLDVHIEGDTNRNSIVWDTHIIRAHATGTNADPWEKKLLLLDKTVPILTDTKFVIRSSTEHDVYIHIGEIGLDRRIHLKQIRQLFPECSKMPLAIALDYVREKL